MTLKAAALKRVVAGMPAFSFSADQSDWLAGRDVQAYLNYYQINFAKALDGISHRFGRVRAGNYTLSMHYWSPDVARGCVFLVHGYFDHAGVYQHIIRFLLQNQFAVAIADLPGHGLSSGERACIDSFDEYREALGDCLQLCLGKVPPPCHVVAQSTGAAAILNYLHYNSLHHNSLHHRGARGLHQIVLLAPLVRSYGWSYSRWAYELLRPFVKRVPRSFAVNSHNEEFMRFLRRGDPLQSRYLPLRWVGAKKKWMRSVRRFKPGDCRFLIIQGDGDTTVDWRYNTRLIRKKFPRARLAIVPGARHQLVNESAAYRIEVFQTLLRYLLEGTETTDGVLVKTVLDSE